MKKKVRKVKSWFSKDKKTIKEKFVLTSLVVGRELFSALLRLRKDTKKWDKRPSEGYRVHSDQLRVVVVYEPSPDGRRNGAGQ